MTISADKLLRLLDPNHSLEVRCAAVVVLAEIGPARDAAVAQALCASLDDPQAALRLQSIKAISKLHIAQALSQLRRRVEDGGEEGEASAHALAKLGAKGTQALQELMPRVAPGVRRYIAAALASDGSTSEDSPALHVLLDHDPAVIDAATRSLLEQVQHLNDKKRTALTAALVSMASNKKEPLAPASEAAVMRLLAALDNEKAAGALWERIGPGHPPEVRVAALQGLGQWADAPTKEQLKRLFACASDSNFHLAAPALVILRRLPVQEKAVPEWLSLMHAPDVAIRRLAVDKVGDRDTEEVAAALLEQLGHPDRGLADAALARLARLDHGRAALVAALLEAPNSDKAWSLAKAQVPFAKDYPDKSRAAVFTKACQLLEGNDRRADALLFLLKEAGAGELRERMEKQAATVRKKKGCETALPFLRWLARDPACALPVRLELAACSLRASKHDLSAEARAADPCLGQFLNLFNQHGEEALRQLEEIDWLEPEDLYYLGFHLAEQAGPLRKFGASLLKQVVKRSPRSKVGQSARSKLHSAALD